MDSKKRRSGKKHYNEELIERNTGDSSLSSKEKDRQTYSVQSMTTGESNPDGGMDESVVF